MDSGLVQESSHLGIAVSVEMHMGQIGHDGGLIKVSSVCLRLVGQQYLTSFGWQ